MESVIQPSTPGVKPHLKVLDFKYTKKPEFIKKSDLKDGFNPKPKRETPIHFKSYMAIPEKPEDQEEPRKLSEVETQFNIFNLPEFLPLNTKR